jgi:hypothetical protein
MTPEDRINQRFLEKLEARWPGHPWNRIAKTTHLRFIGGTIYCGPAKRRFNLGPEHRYRDAFTCPGCGAEVPPLAAAAHAAGERQS